MSSGWGEYPIAGGRWRSLFSLMKHKHFPQGHNHESAGASSSGAAEESDQGGSDFAPSADEVARRAYFSYVNHGSLPGHDVQHWLVAEAELLAERNLTRVHGFHHHHTEGKMNGSRISETIPQQPNIENVLRPNAS